MRIDELIRKPLTDFSNLKLQNNRKTIIKFLKNYGFSPLGFGGSATVFSHPNLDYVLKIFMTIDKGYMTFLRFALKNQNSPYVPKIRGKPMKLGRYWHAIRLEKLIVNTNIDLVDIHEYAHEIMYPVGLKDDKNEWNRIILEVEKYPGLREFLNELVQIAQKEKVSLDLHPLNVLFRPGSTVPVYTDPLAGI